VRLRVESTLRCAAGFVVVGLGILAMGATNGSPATFEFLDPPSVPAWGLPAEAADAGTEAPGPEHLKGWARGNTNDASKLPRIRIIAQDEFLRDHGPLSAVVSNSISSVVVTWADTNYFQTRTQVVSTLQGLLSASSRCQTFTHNPFTTGVGRPSIVATVAHREGRPGQLLMYGNPPGRDAFAYRNQAGKWWMGYWESQIKEKSTDSGDRPL